MIKFSKSIPIFLMIATIIGCAPKPSKPVITDSFFSGQAILDTNNNEQIDSEDTPITNAMFIVRLQGGGEFGDQTDDAGKAFLTIPANVEYPVTIRMEAPKDSELILIEPSTITLEEATGETVQFLFSSK